ncbi:hypothetical protein BOX15_Mlig029261g11 [Macrostomum lignano]|uniref:Uncharacterized protein n=1 Tax=Macrostomum lignano TaxID=282301 RepID=A0A267DKZ0_9PLAT|nr:hypothetical protein BOX15_Mlig029261g11 [Macrostomum lignano]
MMMEQDHQQAQQRQQQHAWLYTSETECMPGGSDPSPALVIAKLGAAHSSAALFLEGQLHVLCDSPCYAVRKASL